MKKLFSAIRNPQSAIRNPQSAIRNPQSAIRLLGSTLFLVLNYCVTFAQTDPFAYYQFENSPGVLSTSNNTCTQCSSTCTQCNLLSPLANNVTPSNNTSKVGQYLDLALANGVLKTANFFSSQTIPLTSGITIEVLINLDPNYGLQRSNTFFDLIDNQNKRIAYAYIDYATIGFVTSDSQGKQHTMQIRLGENNSQSWNFFVNPVRGSNWHLLSFVYSGDVSAPYKKIYVDGLLPGDYNSSNTLVSSDFEFDANSDFPLINQDILNGFDLIRFSAASAVDQIKGFFDELAIFPFIKTAPEIYQNYQDVQLGHSYSNGSFIGTLPIADVSGSLDQAEFPVDYVIEGGTNSCLNVKPPDEQLKSFALPRFKPGQELNRNVSWAKAMWMAGITDNNPANASDVQMAVNIQNELAGNWNYYYNFTENASSFALKMIGSTVSTASYLNAAYVNDINTSGKNYPLAGLLYRSQMDVSSHLSSPFYNCLNINSIIKPDPLSTNPYQTVITGPRCLLRCPFLEDTPPTTFPCFRDEGSLYPRSNISPYLILHPQNRLGKPSWSPLSYNLTNVYHFDGVEMVRLLKEYVNPINNFFLSSESIKRIKMISENNELVTPYLSSTLVDECSAVNADRIINGFIPPIGGSNITTNDGAMSMYQSWAKSNIDLDYGHEILTDATLGLPSDCKFLNYSVDGHDNTQFAYKYYRETNSSFRGNPSLTTSIYPQRPEYWDADNIGGDNTGWKYVTRARNSELRTDIYGFQWKDKWYSPYVSAGYSIDGEHDTRPGQYLGFLKAIDLLGVDFFHAGFFQPNVYGAGRNYCWQVTTPAYAQALNSRIFDFFENGYLLEGDYPWSLAVPNPNSAGYKTAYRFNTNKPDELVVARKIENKQIYALSGTLQATSGYVGSFELARDVTVHLKDNGSTVIKDLTLNIRRQGSTFIFDNTDASNPAFWQLDKWHQYEHPERWSKDFAFEAEVMDNIETTSSKNPLSGVTIKTVDNTSPFSHTPITTGIFTSYTSYVSFETPSPLEYRFQPRNDGVANDYTFFINARSGISGAISGMSLTLTDLNNAATIGNWKINCVNDAGWLWYGIDECSGNAIRFNGLVADHQYMLSIVPSTIELEIDRIYLAAPNTTFAQLPLSPCLIYDFPITNASQPQSASTIFGQNTIAHSNIYLAPDVILEIDDNFTFNNCIFTLSGNNLINVAAGFNLTITDCGFSSCGGMWTGVRAFSNNSIQSQGTAVQDALFAFDFGAHSSANMVNTLFDKNDVSIYADWAGNINIDHSVFDCSGFLAGSSVKSSDHIHAKYSNVTVSNSTMRNAQGTSIDKSHNGNLDVQDCSFERNHNAISIDPYAGSTLNVARNKFISDYNTDGSMKGEYGIAVWGTGGYDIEINIQDNLITDYSRPILVLNITDADINDKTIKNNQLTLTQTVDQLNSTFNYRGIKVENCNGVEIIDNVVSWTKNESTDNDLVQGIALLDSKDAQVTGNLVENTGAGMRIFNDCSGISFLCNTFSKCWTGVYLDVNGANILTDQGDWTGNAATSESLKNQWLNMKNPDEYDIDGIFYPFASCNWMYNPNSPDAIFELDPTKISSSLLNYISALACSTSTLTCTPPSALMRGGDTLFAAMTAQERDALFGAAVGDSALFNTLDPEFLYNANLAFFEAANADSTILFLGAYNDSVYIAAYDSLKQTNMGLTTVARQNISNEEFVQASDHLREIVNPNTIESNAKFAMETYLNHYAPVDTLDSIPLPPPDSSTIEQMSEIVNQHPFYGGKGVYLIQSFLHKDVEVKLPLQRLHPLPVAKKNNEKILFEGKLYPNPASDIINYICKLNSGEKADIILQNALGSTLLNQKVLDGITNINCGSFANGIYYYFVNSNGSIKDKGKLIINR